jgi:predicted secreted protein
VPIDVVLQGDIDGGRANLSIDNEFRIILPPIPGEGTVWNLKNGGPEGDKFKVPAPQEKRAIPLTQTGKARKDGGTQ